MTRTSIREYTEAIRGRYLRVPRKEKGRILDEFTKVTGYHRKAVIRLLHRDSQPETNKRRGRPRQYRAIVVGALRVAWEATNRLCSKRLKSFLPELAHFLEKRHLQGRRNCKSNFLGAVCYYPFLFSLSAWKIFCLVIGKSFILTPAALYIALAMAGAVDVI